MLSAQYLAAEVAQGKSSSVHTQMTAILDLKTCAWMLNDIRLASFPIFVTKDL